MTAKFTGFFEIVPPSFETSEMQDSVRSDGTSYSNFSWYQKMVYGTSSRIARYNEYDQMDSDLDISQGLDIVAEEMVSLTNSTNNLPFVISLNTPINHEINDGTLPTLNAALHVWCKLNELNTKAFSISRQLVKYGDVFFIRPENPKEKWKYIHPNSIIAAIVKNDDITCVVSYVVRTDSNQYAKAEGGQAGYQPVSNMQESEIVPANRMIRFTLNDDMSVEAPFGISPLSYVYRSHKKKQMLEDAIVIYRIQRAPERRVFYIDVGKMPPQRTKSFLEGIKNDMKQKQVPSLANGVSSVDSIYNPQSMSEDFYFAVRPGGSNSRVETLPGGQNLGELTDLEYFRVQVLQGLRIPPSYIPSMQSMATATPITDGINGTLYMPEIQFNKFVRRLQSQVEPTFDREFKLFVKSIGINIDPSIFNVKMNSPTNYEDYRQTAINTELLTAYSNADGISHLSKRFAMSKYLRLTPAEIKLNEQLFREEQGIPENKYNGVVRIYNPDSMDMDASDNSFGASSGGGGGMGGGNPPPSGDLKDDVTDEESKDSDKSDDSGDTQNPTQKDAEKPEGL